MQRKADGAILKEWKCYGVYWNVKGTNTKDLEEQIRRPSVRLIKANKGMCLCNSQSNLKKANELYINDATEFEEF